MEQLKLLFELENPVLPKELDRLFVSFLKAAVQSYSQEWFEQLYDKSRSIIKNYTFSYYLPNAKFSADRILLGEKHFTMFFSDCNLGELILFLNAFKTMQYKNYPLSGNTMRLNEIKLQQRKKITDTEIVVKMQSSLIARKHCSENNTDYYYTYNQPEFGVTVKENVRVFLEKSGISVSCEEFSIVAVKGKKAVVPVFGRNTDTNLGIYKLTGKPELLNLLYLAGIGARRSEGHGKFEVLW